MKDVKRLKKAGLLFCQKPVKIDETVSLIQFKHENGGVLEYSTDSSNDKSLIDEILLPKILTCNPVTSEYSLSKLSELSKWFLGEDQGIFSDWENSFIFTLDSVYTLSSQHITESVISGNLVEFTMPLRIFKILKVLRIKTFQVTVYGNTVFLYGNNGQLKITYQNCFDKLIKLTQSAKNSFDNLKKNTIETDISFNCLKKDIDKIKSVSDNIVDLTKKDSFLNLPIVADIRYLRILAGNKNKLKSLSYQTNSYSYHYYCGSYNERINFFFCGARQPL